LAGGHEQALRGELGQIAGCGGVCAARQGAVLGVGEARGQRIEMAFDEALKCLDLARVELENGRESYEA